MSHVLESEFVTYKKNVARTKEITHDVTEQVKCNLTKNPTPNIIIIYIWSKSISLLKVQGRLFEFSFYDFI